MDNNKNLFIAIGVVIVVVAVAYFAFSKPKSEDANLVSEQGTDMTDIEKEMLNKLDTVKKIKVDTNVFRNPAFKELVDYSRAIAEEPVGRANPFAPVGLSIGSINESDLEAQGWEPGSLQDSGAPEQPSFGELPKELPTKNFPKINNAPAF